MNLAPFHIFSDLAQITSRVYFVSSKCLVLLGLLAPLALLLLLGFVLAFGADRCLVATLAFFVHLNIVLDNLAIGTDNITGH